MQTFFLSFLKKTNFLLLRRKCVFSETITELLDITQPLKTFFKAFSGFVEVLHFLAFLRLSDFSDLLKLKIRDYHHIYLQKVTKF